MQFEEKLETLLVTENVRSPPPSPRALNRRIPEQLVSVYTDSCWRKSLECEVTRRLGLKGQAE